MKLLAVLLITVSVVAGGNHASNEMVQLCGADLYAGLTRACDNAKTDMLKQVQYHHQADNRHNHQDHGDHQSGYIKSHVKKRSLVDECCAKPCHIEEFMKYCPLTYA